MLYEFDKSFTVDTGDLGVIASGSGVRLSPDFRVKFQLNDETLAAIKSSRELKNNAYISGINIDILDITGGMVYSGYRSGLLTPSFTLTAEENIDIFGEYTKDLGICASVVKADGSISHVSHIYSYSNALEISGLLIRDHSGYWSGYNATGAVSQVTGEIGYAVTGNIELRIDFNNSHNYTQYNKIGIYGATSGSPSITSDNFWYEVPINTIGAKSHSFTLKNPMQSNTGYWLKFVPYSTVATGESWTSGPYYRVDSPSESVSFANQDNLYLGDIDSLRILQSGYLPPSTTTTIDTLSISGYKDIDYMIRISPIEEEDYLNINTKLLISGTGTGVSLSNTIMSQGISDISVTASGSGEYVCLQATPTNPPSGYYRYVKIAL